MTDVPERTSPNPWDCLQNPVFRALWIATFISSIGSWMHQVADGWLMATLSPDPFLVSLIQVLTTLPMFMLALPAGTLADLVDRRRYLLFTQSWMLVASATMGVLTWKGWMTPQLLLMATFFMSVGVALNSPGWHSVTPEIVGRKDLHAAVTLNGMAINCARALGPALAGAVLLYFGPAVAFFLNSLSFLSVIAVLLRWKRNPNSDRAPRERFMPAMKGGVRHVRNSPWLRTVLIRAPLFLICSSCLWALIPILCKRAYEFGPPQYGALLALFGLGAVTGAIQILPRLRRKMDLDKIVTLFWLVFACCIGGLGFGTTFLHACVCLFFAGVSWLCVLSNFHFVVQSSAPPWVQGRAMSIYLFFFFGAASTGSAWWGFFARWQGIREAFIAAGGALVLTSLSRFLAPLTSAHEHNLEPSGAWEAPEITAEIPLDHGPVMITVEYEIDEDDGPAFREALEKLRIFRYQNGVLQWGYFVDIADPTKYREVYFEESWGAHLRHHERVSSFETEVAREVYEYHRGEGMPEVLHHGVCNAAFPLQAGAEPGTPPQPRHYETDSRGVPLWFIDELHE
jgi:MFS family permease